MNTPNKTEAKQIQAIKTVINSNKTSATHKLKQIHQILSK